jgi:hypothetical protein
MLALPAPLCTRACVLSGWNTEAGNADADAGGAAVAGLYVGSCGCVWERKNWPSYSGWRCGARSKKLASGAGWCVDPCAREEGASAGAADDPSMDPQSEAGAPRWADAPVERSDAASACEWEWGWAGARCDSCVSESRSAPHAEPADGAAGSPE